MHTPASASNDVDVEDELLERPDYPEQVRVNVAESAQRARTHHALTAEQVALLFPSKS